MDAAKNLGKTLPEAPSGIFSHQTTSLFQRIQVLTAPGSQRTCHVQACCQHHNLFPGGIQS